jgi:hypothetical protein
VLWEAAPGDELPTPNLAEPASNPFARLEDSDSGSGSESGLRKVPEGGSRLAWLLLGLLVASMALIILVAAVRRL